LVRVEEKWTFRDEKGKEMAGQLRQERRAYTSSQLMKLITILLKRTYSSKSMQIHGNDQQANNFVDFANVKNA